MKYKFLNKIKQTAVIVLSVLLLLPNICTPINSVTTGDTPWLWPVPSSYKITSLDILPNGETHYNGQTIDIDANGYVGDDRLSVVSATSGNVLYIVNKYNETNSKGSGFGNYVIVQYGDINILYAHLREVTCGYGEISAGDLIGEMGMTGSADKVHLHFMAYPKGESYLSSDIYVFDYYSSNPMYIQSFEFAEGLEKSPEYGDMISSYYMNEEQGYYGYSGGLDVGFPIDDFYAEVMSVNVGGAPLRSTPVDDNSYIEGTLSFGERISVVGCYRDAYGKMWLASWDGEDYLWLNIADVGFYDFKQTVKLTSETVPSGTYGSIRMLRFGGILSAVNTISSYECAIYSNETMLVSVKTEVQLSEAEIVNTLIESTSAKELADGDYKLVITAYEVCGFPGAQDYEKASTVMSADFTLDSSAADTFPPTVFGVSVSNLTTLGMTVSAEVTDNYEVERATVEVTIGGEKHSFACVIENRTARSEITFEIFEKLSDSLTLTVTAYDYDGNTSAKSRTVILPKAGGAEVWKPNEVLRVRSGPGTSYKQIGTIKTGVSATITDVVYAEKYYWGYKGDGWFALDLSSYVSGYLYSVSFDLSGGSGNFPAMKKRFGTALALPTASPTREGCKFLGWSLSSGSKTADYKAGDKLSENSSVTLFAVWSDSIAPDISSVTLSNTEATNQNVIITVNASDNSGELMYSFDGGITWQGSPEYTVRENKSFPKGYIKVADSFGNVSTYSRAVSVTNIDRIPPSIEDAEVLVEIKGEQAILHISGITDGEGDISAYVFTFSSRSDMSGKQQFTARDGMTLPLESGLYYATLTARDEAGNESVISLDRFYIGTPVRLNKPIGLSVTAITSSSSTVVFEEVYYADKYLAQVSESQNFESYTAFTSETNDIEISGLIDGRNYYVRVYAMSSDGLFPPSEWSEPVSFVTVSGDTSIHGFSSLDDAVIDSETFTASYVAPYFSASLDVTVNIEENAVARYFFDAECKDEVPNIKYFPFEGNSAAVYIEITSPSGTSAVHTLNISRAAESAEAPTVDYSFEDKRIFVFDTVDTQMLTATSNDGGEISVRWYCSFNGGKAEKVGEGITLVPSCQSAGSYTFYAVVTNTNDKCSDEAASVTTESFTVTVVKRTSGISIICPDYFYNGKTPTVAIEGYTGDGVVTVRYFSDISCKNEIQPPVLAGSYYAVAYASETDSYNAAVSEPKEFSIKKLAGEAPKYSIVQPTLRDRYAHITFETGGVEYRYTGQQNWSLLLGKTLDIEEGKSIEARIADTQTTLAGEAVIITAAVFAGARDFEIADGAPAVMKDNSILIDKRGITAASLKSMLVNSVGVSVYTEDGEKLSQGQAVGTGCIITIEDERGVYKSVTAVIKGDLDGDGVVTRSDANSIMYLSNGMELIESSYELICADIDGNGIITSADAYLALKLVNN